MKPGDVVILKAKIVESEDGMWSASSKADELILIEGKADIGGCILAKDYKGEIHCINPDLFEVLWTQEEVVARKMMEESRQPRFLAGNAQGHLGTFTGPNLGEYVADVVARAVAKDIDDSIINGMLSTVNEKGTRRIARQLGMGDR